MSFRFPNKSNTIQTESKGGGDSTPIFDYEYEETPFDSWGEAFSAFLDIILGGIPRMKDAFRALLIGSTACPLICWKCFISLEKVEAIGRELANALN